jgi:threonine dehydrogenase-like Zn-dependent dehydrogenase
MGLEQHSGAGVNMWSYRLAAPFVFEKLSVPQPQAPAQGQVLLRFLAAGICGSDIPGFRGTQGRLPADTGDSTAGIVGFPIHEIVGEVIASRHPDHQRGDLVVGWASGFDGLCEQVLTDGDGVAAYNRALEPRHAVALQPLACVLYALEQIPDLAGRRVAVIGQGSIGLLFAYVAKTLGAVHVTGIDPIDRSALAGRFGVDTAVRATSDRWVRHLDAEDRPHVVIEAVGHQVATLGHAVEAAAAGGTVFYFGVPDDDWYPISMRTLLRNNLTLKSGVTLNRRRVLRRAGEFAAEHPDLLGAYVTHTFGTDDVQAAFDLAVRPDPARVKIAIAG